MIKRVVIRRFKRFDEVTFDLPGHIVLAGPNNAGKTTLLQAVAAWSLALNRWKELNDFQRHGGAYAWAPIARQAFSAVPLRVFDLLWHKRDHNAAIEIEVVEDSGRSVCMELKHDSTEQVYLRPKKATDPAILKEAQPAVAFVPPMTGLGIEEPVYQDPKITQLLGMARPGEVLRNLLVKANASAPAWESLTKSITKLFGYKLLPPDATGAHIIAEYEVEGRRFDIASAGSGFQQVLMLLTFLNTRPATVLLLDEPDAHLHVILQDAIYGELRDVAAREGSQLVIATHSEVIIDSVEPSQLCVVVGKPRLLADSKERSALIKSLRVLSNTDIMEAHEAPGVLYAEDYTDIDILRAWAKTLGHKTYYLLATSLLWKRTVIEPRTGAAGVSYKDHYEALKLVREIPGVALLDGDANPDIPASPLTGRGLQRLRWRRYEIESYLVHPSALERYVVKTVGAGGAAPHVADLKKHFVDTYPPAFLKNPFEDPPYLTASKAREVLLPPALAAAGLPGIPYTRYHEIAAQMLPEEIHPEVKEKLDGIMKAFGL